MKHRDDILFLTLENSRIKIKDISSYTKKSSQLVKYNIKELLKKSDIYSPHTIVDYSYFGLMLFRTYFKGAYVSEKEKNQLIRYFSEDKYVVSVSEMEGEYDLVAEIASPNPSRFNKVLKEMISTYPSLTKYRVSLNLVTYIYPRRYLTGNERIKLFVPQSIVLGGDREKEDFTQKEIDIIKEIVKNPNIRMTVLSKKANLNVRTASKIISGLRSRNIIRGYKYLLNTSNLGITRTRLFLKFQNLNKESEDNLTLSLESIKEVVSANKTLGDWELEIDIESSDKTRIRKIIMELREKFKDIIEDFTTMEILHISKRDYLPGYILSD